jgi:hypothetical protein
MALKSDANRPRKSRPKNLGPNVNQRQCVTALALPGRQTLYFGRAPPTAGAGGV